MAHFMKVSALCVTLTALTMLGGCSKNSDNWLIGKWAFDLEKTKANLPADHKAQGVPEALAQQMGEQLINQLIDQMKNVTFDITAEKMAVISGSSAGKSGTYDIIERPDANTLVVKSDKSDETSTFIKSGKYICVPSTGAVQFKMYFKPVN
jgi:hypothetical protein